MAPFSFVAVWYPMTVPFTWPETQGKWARSPQALHCVTRSLWLLSLSLSVSAALASLLFHEYARPALACLRDLASAVPFVKKKFPLEICMAHCPLPKGLEFKGNTLSPLRVSLAGPSKMSTPRPHSIPSPSVCSNSSYYYAFYSHIMFIFFCLPTTM